MKAPGDTRPTWRNGIIQIHITRACDLSCIGCTQGSNLAGKPVMMTEEQFETAVATLSDYYGVVGIFGGNPCIHPKFPEICTILQRAIPRENRGLWSNNLLGHGTLCRDIFNPECSNLNVHCNTAAYMEMLHDWPECHPKGLRDSRHSPPFVAIDDMTDLDPKQKWDLISNCDINQYWSAMIGVFRGELRAWFCELAGAQSMLHENEKYYPDTGVKVEPGWWKQDINYFKDQVLKHCFDCGIPLRGYGDLAVTGTNEYVSKTHESIYKLKRPANKRIIMVTDTRQLQGHVQRATDYIENGSAAKKENEAKA